MCSEQPAKAKMQWAYPAWEDFRSKWLSFVFDKMVLGVALGILIAIVQGGIADQQKRAEIVRQAAANVANVSSGLLSDERKALSDSVAELMVALANADDRPNRLAFSKALVATETQVWKAEAVFHGLWPKDPVDFEPFRKVLFDIDKEWLGEDARAAASATDQMTWSRFIQRFQQRYRVQLSDAYVGLVKAMQVAIVGAAVSDAHLAIASDRGK